MSSQLHGNLFQQMSTQVAPSTQQSQQPTYQQMHPMMQYAAAAAAAGHPIHTPTDLQSYLQSSTSTTSPLIPATQALQEWSLQGGWTRSAPFSLANVPTAPAATLSTTSKSFPAVISSTPKSPSTSIVLQQNNRPSASPISLSTDITPVSSPQILQTVQHPSSTSSTSRKRDASDLSSTSAPPAKKSALSTDPLTPASTPTPSTSTSTSTSKAPPPRRLPIVPAAIAAAAASVGMNLTDEELAAASVVETENGQRKFACPFQGCSKMFTTSGHLSRHIKGHSGAKPYACPIQGCTSRFSRHDNMMQHYRSHTRRVTNPYQYGTPAFYSSIYRPQNMAPTSTPHLHQHQQHHHQQQQQQHHTLTANGVPSGPTVASPYHLASNAYMTQQQHIAQHQQGMSSYPQNGGENGESGEGRD